MNAVALSLLMLAPASAPDLKVPARASGAPADFVQVAAETTGKVVKWVALDPGLSVFPAALLKDSRTAVVSARAPGTYRLMAVTCAADEMSEPAVCLVVISDGDALARSVQRAYEDDDDPDKAKAAQSLATLYRQAAADPFLKSCKTWGSLQGAMADAAAILGCAGKARKVQAAVGEELRSRLPAKDASEREIDDAGRKLAAEVFLRVSKALEVTK